MGLRMQTRNETFFPLFSKAGSSVVESAAILMEFVAAPHERWAKLAKRLHDTEHADDDHFRRRARAARLPERDRLDRRRRACRIWSQGRASV